MIFLSIVVLASLFVLTLAQTQKSPSPTSGPTVAPWSGCVNPNNPNQPEIIKIGSPHTICLTLGPGGNWAAGVEYGRYTWRPKADEYSRFHIPQSYQQLIKSQSTGGGIFDGNITIHAAAQDMLSFLRVYFDPKETRVFPFLTAVIDVSNGIVQGIAWDNACVFCNKQRCVENMYNFDGVVASELGVTAPSKGCYFTEEECNKIHIDGGTQCDVTLYVVWTGTDQDGRTFQSSGKRFSAFPPARLQDSLMNNLPSFSDFNPFR